MNIPCFLVLVLPPLVVGAMAMSVFVMTIRERPLVGALALINVFAEIFFALLWMGFMRNLG